MCLVCPRMSRCFIDSRPYIFTSFVTALDRFSVVSGGYYHPRIHGLHENILPLACAISNVAHLRTAVEKTIADPMTSNVFNKEWNHSAYTHYW